MSELGRLSGCSQSTVSRALSNHPLISEATKEKIQTLARRHGYRPSPGLRALCDRRWADRRKPSTVNLAYVIRRDHSQAPIRRTFRKHLDNHAAERGYGVVEFHFEDYPDPRRLSEVVFNRGIQGMIFSTLTGPEEIRGIDWNRFSAVSADFQTFRPPFHLVTTNLRSGVNFVWPRARERGYRRIGIHLLQPEYGDYHSEQQGQVLHLQSLLSESETAVPMYCDRSHHADDRDHFLEWVETERPDCILSHTDDAFRLLIEAGYRIPEDIAFVGLRKRNAAYTTNWTHPDIAGLELNIDLHARLVIDQVDRMIRRNETGLPQEQIHFLFDRTWVEGPSFATPQAELPG